MPTKTLTARYPAVRQALAELPYAHIYPDPEQPFSAQALSCRLGLPQEHLLAGAGADELIDLLMRLLIEPGDAILNCPPTFGMYAFDGRSEQCAGDQYTPPARFFVGFGPCPCGRS